MLFKIKASDQRLIELIDMFEKSGLICPWWEQDDLHEKSAKFLGWLQQDDGYDKIAKVQDTMMDRVSHATEDGL